MSNSSKATRVQLLSTSAVAVSLLVVGAATATPIPPADDYILSTYSAVTNGGFTLNGLDSLNITSTGEIQELLDPYGYSAVYAYGNLNTISNAGILYAEHSHGYPSGTVHVSDADFGKYGAVSASTYTNAITNDGSIGSSGNLSAGILVDSRSYSRNYNLGDSPEYGVQAWPGSIGSSPTTSYGAGGVSSTTSTFDNTITNGEYGGILTDGTANSDAIAVGSTSLSGASAAVIGDYSPGSLALAEDVSSTATTLANVISNSGDLEVGEVFGQAIDGVSVTAYAHSVGRAFSGLSHDDGGYTYTAVPNGASWAHVDDITGTASLTANEVTNTETGEITSNGIYSFYSAGIRLHANASASGGVYALAEDGAAAAEISGLAATASATVNEITNAGLIDVYGEYGVNGISLTATAAPTVSVLTHEMSVDGSDGYFVQYADLGAAAASGAYYSIADVHGFAATATVAANEITNSGDLYVDSYYGGSGGITVEALATINGTPDMLDVLISRIDGYSYGYSPYSQPMYTASAFGFYNRSVALVRDMTAIANAAANVISNTGLVAVSSYYGVSGGGNNHGIRVSAVAEISGDPLGMEYGATAGAAIAQTYLDGDAQASVYGFAAQASAAANSITNGAAGIISVDSYGYTRNAGIAISATAAPLGSEPMLDYAGLYSEYIYATATALSGGDEATARVSGFSATALSAGNAISNYGEVYVSGFHASGITLTSTATPVGARIQILEYSEGLLGTAIAGGGVGLPTGANADVYGFTAIADASGNTISNSGLVEVYGYASADGITIDASAAPVGLHLAGNNYGYDYVDYSHIIGASLATGENAYASSTGFTAVASAAGNVITNSSTGQVDVYGLNARGIAVTASATPAGTRVDLAVFDNLDDGDYVLGASATGDDLAVAATSDFGAASTVAGNTITNAGGVFAQGYYDGSSAYGILLNATSTPAGVQITQDQMGNYPESGPTGIASSYAHHSDYFAEASVSGFDAAASVAGNEITNSGFVSSYGWFAGGIILSAVSSPSGVQLDAGPMFGPSLNDLPFATAVANDAKYVDSSVTDFSAYASVVGNTISNSGAIYTSGLIATGIRLEATASPTPGTYGSLSGGYGAMAGTGFEGNANVNTFSATAVAAGNTISNTASIYSYGKYVGGITVSSNASPRGIIPGVPLFGLGVGTALVEDVVIGAATVGGFDAYASTSGNTIGNSGYIGSYRTGIRLMASASANQNDFSEDGNFGPTASVDAENEANAGVYGFTSTAVVSGNEVTNSGYIETIGDNDNSDGISLFATTIGKYFEAGGDQVTATLSASGDYASAHASDFEATASVVGNTISNSGTISTSGSSSHGISLTSLASAGAFATAYSTFVDGDAEAWVEYMYSDAVVLGNTISNTSLTSITTSGNDSHGIALRAFSGATAAAEAHNEFDGYGTYAVFNDIYATAGIAVNEIDNSGRIETYGYGSHGISLVAEAELTLNLSANSDDGSDYSAYAYVNGNTITNTGLIYTHSDGDSAHGIYLAAYQNNGTEPGTVDENTINNSALIVSYYGDAIHVSNGTNTTLNLSAPAFVGGAFDLGTDDGDAVVNITTGPSHSVLWHFDRDQLEDGSFATITDPYVPGFVAYEFFEDGDAVFATMDPSAIAAAPDMLADFTGMTSGFMSSSFEKADKGTGFWIAGSSGQAFYAGDGMATLDQKTVRSAVALGLTRQAQDSGMSFGFMGGFGQTSLDVDGPYSASFDNSASGGFGGVFIQANLGGSAALTVGISGGVMSHVNDRFVNDNLEFGGVAGSESNHGSTWYSPMAELSGSINAGGGWTITPTAHVRFASQSIDGYTETGSHGDATVAAWTTTSLEGRLEIAASRTLGASTFTVTGGYFARQTGGDSSVTVGMIGDENNIPVYNTGYSSPYLGLQWTVGVGSSASLSVGGKLQAPKSSGDALSGSADVLFNVNF